MAEKEEDGRVFISEEQAWRAIDDAKYIHTFRNPANGALLGADVSRESLLAKFKKFPDKIELGGDACRAMKHGLVFEDEHGFLFIAADNKELDKIEKEIGAKA